jgi:hypothetical protein
VTPDVFIRQTEIDFESVYIGGTMKIPVTMVNNSAIVASLECDFRAYPSFAVELPKDNWSSADYEMAPVMRVSGNPDSPPKTVSGEREPTPLDDNGEPAIGSMYKMTVAPNKVGFRVYGLWTLNCMPDLSGLSRIASADCFSLLPTLTHSLKAPGFNPWNLECDLLISSLCFAFFKCNL